MAENSSIPNQPRRLGLDNNTLTQPTRLGRVLKLSLFYAAMRIASVRLSSANPSAAFLLKVYRICSGSDTL